MAEKKQRIVLEMSRDDAIWLRNSIIRRKNELQIDIEKNLKFNRDNVPYARALNQNLIANRNALDFILDALSIQGI